ncbi:MAG: sulfur carrier protein ThiS [Opitutaceae bacterium]|nr:sulfur carrier protein ThiS [Opitutaceae bacterium]
MSSSPPVRQAAAGATIFLNDRPRLLSGPTSLLMLLDQLGLAARKGVAVAVNDAVVPRTAWPACVLADADRVLVIQATQGG